MFYTDPTNVLIHKLRIDLGRNVYNLAAIEYEERTSDHTGDWVKLNRLDLDWEAVRAKQNVDFEGEIFPPIWAFVVENVRKSKAKSVRLRVWTWRDNPKARGTVELVDHLIFPLPIAGIRLRGEDKHSPQDPAAKAVRSGKGREVIDSIIGGVIGQAQELSDNVRSNVERQVKKQAKGLSGRAKKGISSAIDEFFHGLEKAMKDDDDKK